MSIQSFYKQPGDKQDIDVDFIQWLPATDNIRFASAAATTGINLDGTLIDLATKQVKQWVSGGITGSKYKITITMTSIEGRIKEQEFYIKVKEI